MELEEITEEEFKEIGDMLCTYFCNGCFFDEYSDNLIAFPFYESGEEKPSKYFKVVEL